MKITGDPAHHALVRTRTLLAILRDRGIPVVSVTKAFRDGEIPTGVCLQLSYDPVDGIAVLDLMGLTDALWDTCTRSPITPPTV